MNRIFHASTLLIVVAALSQARADDRPNILFLLSDDQAWNGLSCRMHPDVPGSKSGFIQTPNIARLAGQGMRFSAAYSPASVCSPTRISLQTGKSPAQCRWTKAAPTMTAEDGFKLVPPRSRKNIEAGETTIGEMLKSAGYATADFGKWHLGGGGPESHGYDESDGATGNQDAAPHVEPNPVDIFGMGKRAMAFMEKNRRAGNPFFVQMSYHALHYPQNATKALVEKYRRLNPRGNDKEIGRAAIAEDLDRGVGELMAKIDGLGIADNTYVIYMSDNGSSTKNTLRGGKGGVWEGGIRVPLIVRGPGIAEDSWCHQRVVGYDFFPTLCELAGVKEALPANIEGGSITHLFRGEAKPVKRPREELVFHFPHYQGDTPHSALLLGDWKIMHFYETGETHLFDLASDIAERSDLAKQKPELAGSMKEKLFVYLEEVDAQMPEKNPQYDPENPPSLKENRGEKKGGGGRKGGGGKGKGGGGKRDQGERAEARDEGAKDDRRDAGPTLVDAPREQRGGGGGERGPVFSALDTNRDKEISAEELANAAKALKSLDRDGSGQLEGAEFRAVEGLRDDRRDAGPTVRTPWMLVHALELDADGDGVVEFQAELMDEARRVFAAYDKDGNGKITADESSSKGGVRSALGGFVKEHATELDRDRDGGISKEEMAGQFAKFFSEADKNGDKKLTKDEYEVEGGVRPRFPEKVKENVGPASRRSSLEINDRRDAGPTLRPNIVLFLIDDMGWNGMGFSGNTFVETPRTDKMARQGMVFTNAYASAPNCAPTRACLMSGQYTPRHGVFTVVDDRHAPGSLHHKVLAAESESELATESVTIAESLKAAGYATGMFGMWNLGRGKAGPTTPTGQGFEVFKQPRDLGFEKDRYFNDRGEYLTDAFTTGGIRWVEENKGRPFFLYLAFHAVHSPFEPKPELLKKYREKPGGTGARDEAEYAATVEAVDQNVGRLVDGLERLGLSENTVVIFHSDNGGTRHYIRPLNGGKGTLYEGGIRVPTAVWGRGIRQGVSEEPMLSMDLYPTVLELAGIEKPKGHVLDGESLMPILDGSADRLGRERVFWHFPSYIGGGGPSSAMRKGDWKVIEFFESKRFEVYHLADDPGETRDLFMTEPEKAKELIGDLRRWQEETGAPRPTGANPDYDPTAIPKRGRDQRGKGRGKEEVAR